MSRHCCLFITFLGVPHTCPFEQVSKALVKLSPLSNHTPVLVTPSGDCCYETLTSPNCSVQAVLFQIFSLLLPLNQILSDSGDSTTRQPPLRPFHPSHVPCRLQLYNYGRDTHLSTPTSSGVSGLRPQTATYATVRRQSSIICSSVDGTTALDQHYRLR